VTVLTVEAIEANAWNAVEGELPEDANLPLLNVVLRAVQLCVARERKLMEMAEELHSRGAGQAEGRDWGSVKAHHKARWQQASERLHLIADCYKRMLRAYNEARPYSLQPGRALAAADNNRPILAEQVLQFISDFRH